MRLLAGVLVACGGVFAVVYLLRNAFADEGVRLESSRQMPAAAVQAWHQAHAAQPLDPSWGSNVEPQLQAHLSVPNQQTPKTFDILSMECRKSICEIRATASSKELNSQSLDDFQDRLSSMPKETWWSSYGLVEPMLDVSVALDGTLMLVAYVSSQRLSPP